MSLQIIKKFIAPDAVDGSKIKLLNNQALRARNAANSADIDIIKLNVFNDLVLDGNDIDMSAAVVKNIDVARVTSLKIGASQLSLSQGSVGAQEKAVIDAGQVELLCSAAPTTNDSLANKAYVDAQISALGSATSTFVQYGYTLQAQDISNGYVDLQDAAVHESIVASMARQMLMGGGVDYTTTDVGGVTRLTFNNDTASGGNLAAAVGDIMYFLYLVA